MKPMPIKDEMIEAIVTELGQSALFKELPEQARREIASKAAMVQYDPGEVIMSQGDAPDGFYVTIAGEVIVRVQSEGQREPVEVARIRPFDTVGETALLLNEPRTATLVAGPDTVMLKFNRQFFAEMFRRFPEFSLVTCRVLARRLHAASLNLSLPPADPAALHPDPSVLVLLPMEFIQRHRVLPLKVDGNVFHVGFLGDPTPQVVSAVRELLPGMELRPVTIDRQTFDGALQGTPAPDRRAAPAPAAAAPAPPPVGSPRLDALLKRMVAEGASDVHLSAGHRPRWRIDGEIREIPDTTVLSPTDVIDLAEPLLSDRIRRQYREDNDADFAYAIPGTARFRVNLFVDHRGSGAVLRQIPDKILTLSQLGMPPVVQSLCDFPTGLVLVTGPTGSGKSTTLAAMVDHINKTRMAHVITMEDPIEFVHQSQKCLVNQREIGPHSRSFARALKAALREDPNVVLVGEMRDLETVTLALETANTGHLVFATLHTNTAITTIARIIDMFPGEQQGQVRTVLADNLRGVIAQTLCRRIGGGRVAALEILVSDTGVASLIRDGKAHQLVSAMQTGKARGNRLLNDELFRLVGEKVIAPQEALNKAVDKIELSKRLGLDPSKSAP